MVKDLAAIAGLVMLSGGCALAWPPLGLIVPGGLILAAAVAGHVLTGPAPPAEGDDDS